LHRSRRGEVGKDVRRLLLAIADPEGREEPLPDLASTDREEWDFLLC
jgi:hypothetical protein